MGSCPRMPSCTSDLQWATTQLRRYMWSPISTVVSTTISFVRSHEFLLKCRTRFFAFQIFRRWRFLTNSRERTLVLQPSSFCTVTSMPSKVPLNVMRPDIGSDSLCSGQSGVCLNASFGGHLRFSTLSHYQSRKTL